MWAYVTTSKSMEPLYALPPRCEPFDKPKTLNGHSTRTSKAAQTGQNWINVLIFDMLILPPFISKKTEIYHIGVNVGLYSSHKVHAHTRDARQRKIGSVSSIATKVVLVGQICYVTPAFSRVRKQGTKSESEGALLPSRGPTSGQKCYATPTFSGVPNRRRTKSELTTSTLPYRRPASG